MTDQTAEQSLTHHVALVLDNDYDLYQHRLALVRESQTQRRDWEAEYGMQDEDGAVRVSYLADSLKDWAEALVGLEDDGHSLLAREILTTAIAWVDWRELARGYLCDEAE